MPSIFGHKHLGLALLCSVAQRSVLLAVPVVATAGMIACADESQPEYWIEKLDDKQWRPKAIERLNQFYEDALTNAGKDPTKPEVKALLDKLVDPLTKIYIDEYQNLDEKARESLINLLAAFRDQRTEPALKKAFEEFGKRGRGGKDVKWAARAVRDMKLKSAAPAVFEAFKKTKPSTKEGAYYRDLNEALLAIPESSWAPELIAMVETEFPMPEPGKKATPDQVGAMRDQAYLSITAAQVLGELGDASAVKPLIKLILDPTRGDAANEALLALTKIGKPAVDATVKLLNDQDKELADYHKKRMQRATGADKPPEGSPHVARAAAILGAIGRTEGIAPLLTALAAAKEDADKVPLLNALVLLPHTPEVKAAFKDGFSALSATASYEGQNASMALSEGATLFFDPAMTDMLVSRGKELKEDKLAMSLLALAAVKTMDESQVGSVKELIDSIPAEKEEGPMKMHLEKIPGMFELAKKMMGTCKKDATCYLKEAEKTENQGEKTQMAGMKALYMVGQLKGPESGEMMIEAFGALDEGSLRYVASQVIDHHHPKGSKELADKLQAIVDKNAESMDQDRASGDKPLRDTMYRLRARAQ
jgi:hypothetical protein